MKPKRCKACKLSYTPTRPLQICCGYLCAILLVKLKTDKKARKALKDGREKLKSRKQREGEAKSAMQLYVRLRDYHLGCCSCDKPASWDGQWHGSHFRPATNSATRFNLLNINKSCSQCNLHNHGALAGYEPKLVIKIGQDRVDWLKSQNHIVKYDIDYLRRIKAIFTRKARILKKRLTID